jgi:hypothetical protein
VQRIGIRAVATMVACLMAAAGLLAVVPQAASAATSAFTLTMTSGTLAVHGGSPTALPTPASIAGRVSSTTGDLSAATLTIPALHETHTGSSETIRIFEPTGGSGSGSISYDGNVVYNDTLSVEVHITSPVTQKCTATPVEVSLRSTSPYDTSTKDVTLSDTTFTIPDFGSATCSLAASSLDSTFSGSSGNGMVLKVHGTLPEPPAPATTSATTLSVSPTSPQVHGVAVTLKATVKKTTGAPATTATGTVAFRNGTTVLSTGTVTGGTASYTTTSLPVGTDRLTAVYSGDSSYKTSTSAAATFVVKPTPSVTLAGLPSTVTGGTATEHPFTLVVTNPSNGVAWTHLFAKLTFSGIRNLTTSKVSLQYQDTSSGWCDLLGYTSTTSVVSGSFAGVGTSCTPNSFPASFSLAAGSSLTVHLRIAYSRNGYFGTQKITTTVFTGTCSSATPTSCAAVAPLSGSVAPVSSGLVEVVPASKIVSQLTDVATRKATSTVRKTFSVPLNSTVAPGPTVTARSGLPAPTGTVSYAVDGTTVATSTLVGPLSDTNVTALILYNTADLALGRHTLVSTYSGDDVYASSTLTETFTVITAPTGTPFTCVIAGQGSAKIQAYVSASGTVPPITFAQTATTLTVTNISVTLDADPAADAGIYNTNQSAATLGFSPTGTSVRAGPITFAGTTKTVTEVVGTWSGLSTTIPVEGGSAPGSTIAVGAASIVFTAGIGAAWTCKPVTTTAAIRTVTVAGTTLTSTPTSPVLSGSSVTLTASVFPQPSTDPGTITFTDTVTGHSTPVGTVAVSTGAAGEPAKGTATLNVTPSVGKQTYSATWSGTLSVPRNISVDTVVLTVDTVPVVTSQPDDQQVNLGSTATFTAVASGVTTPTVQWQVSANGGGTWADVPDATSTTLAVVTSPTDNGDQYRAAFSNPVGVTTSEPATLTVVLQPVVTTQPTDQTVDAGRSATFTAAAMAAGPPPTVQWQVRASGGKTWSDIAGATSTTLDVTTVSTDTGSQYRAVFTNAVGSTPSSPATLTVGIAGYRLTGSDGSVDAFGDAPYYGSMGGRPLSAPIVGTANTPGDGGYWLVGSDGGIFAFGDAQYDGSMGGQPLNRPIVGIAATSTGGGYWLVAADGGIFAFGNAQFYGSMGGQPLNQPIVGMAGTPDGRGYWLVAADGGIFAFGDAAFYGSTGSMTLTKPIVGIAATPTGGGYWEVASDGGIFAFGAAAFYGSTGGQPIGTTIVGMAVSSDGGGYWLAGADGAVFAFGDAPLAGSGLSATLSAPIVAVAR